MPPAGFVGLGGWVEKEDCGETNGNGAPKTTKKEVFPSLKASGMTSLPMGVASNKQTQQTLENRAGRDLERSQKSSCPCQKQRPLSTRAREGCGCTFLSFPSLYLLVGYFLVLDWGRFGTGGFFSFLTCLASQFTLHF